MLEDQIIFEEGEKLHMYKCTRGFNTIGVGHNCDASPYFHGQKIPNTITKEQSREILADDLQKTVSQLHAAWPQIGLLQGARHDAVIQMAFQLGVNRLLGFKMMLKALNAQEWAKASKEALDSDWAKQTPARAKRVAHQILTGVYYEVPS